MCAQIVVGDSEYEAVLECLEPRRWVAAWVDVYVVCQCCFTTTLGLPSDLDLRVSGSSQDYNAWFAGADVNETLMTNSSIPIDVVAGVDIQKTGDNSVQLSYDQGRWWCARISPNLTEKSVSYLTSLGRVKHVKTSAP